MATYKPAIGGCIVVLFLWILFGRNSMAAFGLPESAQIHGFASLGYFNTTGNNFFGDTKSGGDIDFWELGLNGSWRALPNLQLSMQMVSRQAGETDNGHLRVDFGFLDYSFLSNVENLLGMRLGRAAMPFGLYNETRDMAFTRSGILLPQSIYFDTNRQLSLAADGVQLYGERRSEFGDFFLQLGIGYPRVDDPDIKQVIARDSPGNLDNKLSWIGRLLYEKDGGKLRLAISGGQLNAEFNPTQIEGDTLENGDFTFSPLILSAQYNAERWSLIAEYALRHSSFNDFDGILKFPDPDYVGESFYIQGTYRFNHRWQGMLRYDQLIWDRSDRNGKEFHVLNPDIPAHYRFAKDWTAGLRWDITPAFMLEMEYHRVNGTGWISYLENIPSETKQHWNLFAILAAYRF
jgi:hypothetical protein